MTSCGGNGQTIARTYKSFDGPPRLAENAKDEEEASTGALESKKRYRNPSIRFNVDPQISIRSHLLKPVLIAN